MKKAFAGRFRIVEMEMWGKDYLDMDVPAYMKIEGNGSGAFQFGLVSGQMDCREVERDGKPAIEFSWEGCDEMDPASGRGWAVLEGKTLTGRLFFHMGDDSGFVARRTR
ncbi:MAG: hypothetical protein JW990_07945 [Thermoleophilia bacterium]|nr:hypothetical protein [Thermoleophilia bacterium]